MCGFDYNLCKYSSLTTCKGKLMRNLFILSGYFIIISVISNVFVQSSYIYGQVDPISSSKTCAKLPISGITASGDESLHPASHAADQNLNTRWSNLGLGSWIQIDLGQENVICSVGINWHRGNERINSFVISVSKDGKNFTNVFSGKSDGSSLNEQNYNFQSKTGRFIRVVVNGNTQNDWVSISEVKIYGYKTLSESCVKSSISQVSAASSQVGFPPSNAIDRNLNTIWSNYGVGSWIQLDLGTTKNVCSIDIAWYKGNERQNNFVISSSIDGITFSNILSSKSSGTTLSPEKYTIADTNARYLRITVNGNTQNSYASITEISINLISGPISSNYYIGAAGDWGSARNDNWKKTVQLMINNKVNLALGLGDYSYGSVKEFQPVVDELKKAGIPMKGARGDHDSNSYAEIFGQPSMVFAFDAGPARIIMLDTYKSPSSNVAFLEKELEATKQPWKIVVTSTPLYTSPSVHEADEARTKTKALQPVLDKYNVDVVMWGDNHNYERIKFPDKSTVFIQSGTGGRSHYDFDGQIEESKYQNDKDFGITKITVNSNTLSGQFISHSGNILDSFSISK
jgi:F5/8 type C domain/Calcineurin-like phosphoesterase